MIPERVYVKSNKVEDYIGIIEELFKQVKSGFVEKYSAPLILFCGTCLEYMLNDLFIEHANIYFAGKNQKKYSESFISMNFNSKLTCVLPIITNHALQVDFESAEYKVLCELITLRNQIAHSKDFYRGYEPQNIKENGAFSIVIDKNDVDKINPLNISYADAEKFINAIYSFYESIYLRFYSNSLVTNKFILNVEKNKNLKQTIQF